MIITEKRQIPFSLFLIHLVLTFLHVLGYNYVIQMNINLDIVLEINLVLFACNMEIEGTEQFLLGFHFHSFQRLELFNNLNKINLFFFFKLSAKDQVNILLYGYSLNNSISFCKTLLN